MKELSIEEKAKRYDEAIRKAKDMLSYKEVRQEDMEYLFPELKESEDERIRKELINTINLSYDCGIAITKENRDKYIAWLEKQGEQKYKSNIVPIFKVGDIIKNKKNGDTVKVEQILSDSYCYSGWNSAATIHSDFLISDQGNWELVEQKPADKVEPKFKVGDWVVNNNGYDYATTIMKIMDVDFTSYLCLYKDGQMSYNFDFINKNYHSLTFKDLFAWRRQSQKPADIIPQDFEKYVEHLLSLSDGEGHGSLAKVKEVSAELFRLAKLEQKPAEWSKDDKTWFDEVWRCVSKEYPLASSYIFQWLKSLKYRIQPKQEWSEEDKKMLDDIIKCGEHHCYLSIENVNWLKSLRPQNRWKPSDEQIIWLYRAADDASKDSRMKQILNELLSDLKKLREE